MTSRQKPRFVDDAVPTVATSGGTDLQAIETGHTLKEAVYLFRKERIEPGNLREACKEAENLLSTGPAGRNLGNLASLDYDSRVAIVAFTLDVPNVCYDFNAKSRDLTSSTWNTFPYKGMWLLLNKAILSHGQQQSSFTVYRGVDVLVVASSTFCFKQVASSSTDQREAQKFANAQGTMFIVKGSKCLYIKDLSNFRYEEEYILPAFDTFNVTKVDNTGSVRKIYLQAFINPPKNDCKIL